MVNNKKGLSNVSAHYLSQFKQRNGKDYKLTSLQEAVKIAKRKKDTENKIRERQKESSEPKKTAGKKDLKR